MSKRILKRVITISRQIIYFIKNNVKETEIFEKIFRIRGNLIVKVKPIMSLYFYQPLSI